MTGCRTSDSRWWDFPFGHCPGSSQDVPCTSHPTTVQHTASWEAFGAARLCRVSVMPRWISLIQTFKQNNTKPSQYRYKKKHLKKPWRCRQEAKERELNPWHMPDYSSGTAESLQLCCRYGGREMLGAEAAELILGRDSIPATQVWWVPVPTWC